MQNKISRAEAVRRAVDRLIQDATVTTPDVGFGVWKHKREKMGKHLESIRKEWE